MYTITEFKRLTETDVMPNDGEWIGYKLTLSDHSKDYECFFLIEDVELCCEIYDVSIVGPPLSVGDKVISMCSMSSYEASDCGSEEIKIKTEHKETVIVISNEHNGYYHHMYKCYYYNPLYDDEPRESSGTM